MSIHPMTKVTGVLDISNKIVKCEPYLDNNVWKLKVSFYADGNVHIEFDNEVYDGPLEFLLRI